MTCLLIIGVFGRLLLRWWEDASRHPEFVRRTWLGSLFLSNCSFVVLFSVKPTLFTELSLLSFWSTSCQPTDMMRISTGSRISILVDSTSLPTLCSALDLVSVCPTWLAGRSRFGFSDSIDFLWVFADLVALWPMLRMVVCSPRCWSLRFLLLPSVFTESSLESLSAIWEPSPSKVFLYISYICLNKHGVLDYIHTLTTPCRCCPCFCPCCWLYCWVCWLYCGGCVVFIFRNSCSSNLSAVPTYYARSPTHTN